ncbi:uncharacterized protein LY89DRAFT_781592 [Mollisia scopiformis]|uniref:Copper acquisition factor BIM1-like domain-containing protein n=1 Tax=Mollisia scopiformis TaxID=149040 RepID=A0A194XB37_MOLSC|nr:uncharacterized protein LY89DRAFT_781592 [Mollisia scopiformis]KUJ17378.1 hypothetical protein LY89DRAFT_781592 [Mollisia scopiformis]
MSKLALLILALATTISAHFQINTPQWRDNSFNAPYSQYIYPCAGVPSNSSTNIINETGNGTLCIDKFTLPTELAVVDGQLASLQVVTVGETGAALYNCADIQFSSNASLLDAGSCSNSSGVSWDYLDLAGTSTTGGNATGTGAASTETAKSGALRAFGGVKVDVVIVGLVVGLAVLGM